MFYEMMPLMVQIIDFFYLSLAVSNFVSIFFFLSLFIISYKLCQFDKSLPIIRFINVFLNALYFGLDC